MNRRRFLLLAFCALAIWATALVWRHWWVTRRLLIGLRLLRSPANLLRNADFAACANPGVPDFWGTDAAAHLEDFSNALTIQESRASRATALPIHGARVLRLSNPRHDYLLKSLSSGTFVPEAEPYSFSVYLRSDDAPLTAALSIGWGDKQFFEVTRNWQRYQVSRTPVGETQWRSRMSAYIWLPQAGTLERRIHYALYERRGAYFLILCNISNVAERAVFDLSTVVQTAAAPNVVTDVATDTTRLPTTLRCWYRGDNKTLDGSWLRMHLAPYEREVLEIE